MAFLHVLALSATLACQQGERRDSPGEVAATLPAHPTPIPTLDPEVRAAQIDLADGRAWAATRRLARLVGFNERRSPEALLVAARAAAAWGGWDEVRRLLASEGWVNSRFSGEGLELLARSALERGDASEARARAENALRNPSDPAARAIRLVLLARALDRLDVRDSAAATYRRAAEALPLARDWLLLRAAGSTAEARARERLYELVRSPVAHARVPFTEAQALERFNMLVAAATAYDSAGDKPSAFRLRLASTKEETERGQLRAGLLRFIEHQSRGDDLQRAIDVLDKEFPDLDNASQLTVSRRAAISGLNDRAARGFASVPAGALYDRDAIAWARALIGSGKPGEAAARIAARHFAPATAAEAEYVAGLALVRAGQGSAARTALQRVVDAYGSTREAADALYLLADLESDARRDNNARALHQRSCVHAPAGNYSDQSCFRAGIISIVLGDYRRAAESFDAVSSRFPTSADVNAARYWAGRAWRLAGNTAQARERWLSVMLHDRNSYYASASARRLGAEPFAPRAVRIAQSPAYRAKVERAAVLAQLGMETEERYEYEAIEKDALAAPSSALGAGAALLDAGQAPRAIKVGWRAINASHDFDHSDSRGYSLVYPLLYRDAVLAQARANHLDPALVAAVVRQESSWNPHAISRAGARGLMQVLPAVGRQIAQSRGYPLWDPALLFNPDVSLELGASHLAAALTRYDNLPGALAAYNAGDSRVRRWLQHAGADDPELFVERIPFAETRDYIRIVLRNAQLYRALYELNR